MAGRAQAVERFTIRTAADLDAARVALEHGSDHVVLLDVPATSDQLTGVRDYRELVTLARVCGMRVRLLSDDPVRRELARIVGMEVADAPAPALTSAPPVAFTELASLSHTNVNPGLRRRRVGAAAGADAPAPTATAATDASVAIADSSAPDDHGMTVPAPAEPPDSSVDALSTTAVRRADDPTRRIASTLAQPERFRPWQAGGDAAPGAARATDVALSPDAADPSFAFLSASTPFPAPARAANPAASATDAAAERVDSHTRQRRSWTKTAPVAPTAAQLAAEQTAVRPPLQADPRVAGLTSRPAPVRGTRRRSRWVGVLVALVLCAALLGGGGYAAAIVLPSASITVTPQQTPVDVTLTYGVATDGAAWDILIEPTTTGRTVSANASVPTTGSRVEPDQAARGEVLITNPLTWEVAITVGTTFVADDGQVFTATEDTIVPAADPLGTLTFGSTTVSVVAAVGGTVGNVAPESISGQLDAGVYYTNRTAFGGGTDRSVATVGQADIDALQATLRDDVQRQVPDATAGLIVNAQHLPGSEQTSEVTFDIQPQVGTDAAEISGSASATVSVDIFTLDAAQEEAQAVIQQRLQDAVASDQQITPDSIHLGTPEALDTSGTAFRVRASGTAVAVLDSAALESLREDLAGASIDDARASFMAQPGVAGVEIETHWAWLAGGLPQRTGQIDLHLTNAAASTTGTHDRTRQPAPASTDDGSGPTRTPAGTPEGAGAGASPTTGP